MKIKLTRTRGQEATINGQMVNTDLIDLSRALTGTDGEDTFQGIFAPDRHVTLDVGKAEKEFQFLKINYVEDSLDEIEQKIRERVKRVREWVNSLPLTEEREFEI